MTGDLFKEPMEHVSLCSDEVTADDLPQDTSTWVVGSGLGTVQSQPIGYTNDSARNSENTVYLQSFWIQCPTFFHYFPVLKPHLPPHTTGENESEFTLMPNMLCLTNTNQLSNSHSQLSAGSVSVGLVQIL